MESKVKKSAIDLTDLAIGIVVLGIAVTIGSVLLINMRDTRLTDLPTVTTTNETTFINKTADTLANQWVASVTSCTNSSGFAIPTTNYTVTIDSIGGTATITNATATAYAEAKCTYAWYNTSQADWALADDAATGIGEFGNWFKIITIVGVAAVVLSLIFMAFGRGSSNTTY
jgi:hypothetical protein